MAVPQAEPPGALVAPSARLRAWRIPSVAVALTATVLALDLLLAALGPALAPHDPRQVHLHLVSPAPSDGFPLGTDQLGRDILSQVMAGARSAVLGPLAIALLTLTLSTIIGVVAGYRGGWLDAVIGRGVDLLYSLPPLMVAILVVGVLGGGYLLAIGVLVLMSLPQNVRVIRAATLEQRALPYVEGSRVLGAGSLHIMFRQILPNLRAVLLVGFFLRFTYGFIDLTTLSFLGLGVAPGTPDWGRMLAESRILVFENAWAALAPLTMIVLTAVSVNVLGDWIYERVASRGRAR
jgi:ABC-type dipeptide/oligopeptide/nickel transport system permease subunit